MGEILFARLGGFSRLEDGAKFQRMDLKQILETEGAFYLEEFLQCYPDTAKIPLANGDLPLVFAIRMNNISAIRIFSQSGLIDWDQMGKDGLTAVDHAVLRNDPEVFSVLFDSIFKKKFVESSINESVVSDAVREIQRDAEQCKNLNVFGMPNIYKAAFEGNLEEVKRLFKSNKGGGEVLGGWSLLHLACLGGRSHVVRWLLDQGGKPFNAWDGKSHLHAAAIGGSLEIIEMLKQTGMYDLNQADARGFTPLHYASVLGSLRTVSELIRGGADPLTEAAGSSPASIVLYTTRKRSQSKDPRAVSWVSQLIFCAYVVSWGLRISGKNEAADSVVRSLSLGTFPMAFASLSHLLVYSSGFMAVQGKDFLLAGHTAFTAFEALRGLASCFQYYELGASYTIRNGIIYGVNVGSAIESYIHFISPGFEDSKESDQNQSQKNFVNKKEIRDEEKDFRTVEDLKEKLDVVFKTRAKTNDFVSRFESSSFSLDKKDAKQILRFTHPDKIKCRKSISDFCLLANKISLHLINRKNIERLDFKNCSNYFYSKFFDIYNVNIKNKYQWFSSGVSNFYNKILKNHYYWHESKASRVFSEKLKNYFYWIESLLSKSYSEKSRKQDR